ncbi:MAG: hypothetical protein AAGD06_32565 [Acidobacteriota bacterium]
MRSPYSTELVAAALRAVVDARRRERPKADELRSAALARAAGVAYPTFRRYFRGQREIPAVALFALLHHLRTTPSQFGRRLERAVDPDV